MKAARGALRSRTYLERGLEAAKQKGVRGRTIDHTTRFMAMFCEEEGGEVRYLPVAAHDACLGPMVSVNGELRPALASSLFVGMRRVV